jgi:D-threo-aldose 1-dehydrogenase
MSDEAARETIEAALAAGMAISTPRRTTASASARRRLGAVLPARPKVSTKVGRLLRPAPEADPLAERHGFVGAAPFEPVFDYSYDGVMRSLRGQPVGG